MGTLNEFHKANWQRMHEAFAPPHPLTALVVCVQEEVGELAAAVLGVTGEKARKAHLTNADVLDAVADAITYLSLVASSVGCDDLERILGSTFNMVSDRAGSSFKTTLGEPERPWTWGKVEIFGRRNHLGRYRWTADERFLDVEELIVERKEDDLVERRQPYRYSAKAIFSLSSQTEEDIRARAKPYEPHGRDTARDAVPPSSDAPESLDF